MLWFGVPVNLNFSWAEGGHVQVFVRVAFSDEDWFSGLRVYGSG